MVVIATSLLRYLEHYRLPYRKHCHLPCSDMTQYVESFKFPHQQILLCELFSDGINTFQFITALDKAVTTAVLEEIVGKALTKLSVKQANKIFFDCEPGAVPPLGERYGLQCLIDREILQAEQVFFSSGCLSSLIELSQCAFKALFEFPLYVSEPKGLAMSAGSGIKSAQSEEAGSEGEKRESVINLLSNYNVPMLHPLAARIICFVRRGGMCNEELLQIVKSDGLLEAKLIQYANSPLHHYPKHVETAEQAINDVLGVELSSYLMLSMASAEAFRIPLSGQFGGHAFWRHSFLNAVLSQSLARHLPKSGGVLPSASYISGLFHNFGLMLVAHLFPPEFKLLERLKAHSPKQPLSTIEKKVMGMGSAQEVIARGHGELGGELLNYWQFPEVVQYVAAHHHDDRYCGDYEKYVQLIRLSNLLLAREGIGDDCADGDIRPCLETLQMEEAMVERVFKQVLTAIEKTDSLSRWVAVETNRTSA